MKIERININNIPSIIWGEKSNKVFIAVHGNMSNKEDEAIKILAEKVVLNGNKDNMQEQNIIKDFSDKFNCELSILENGEHYFHTEEQLKYYENWLDGIIK